MPLRIQALLHPSPAVTCLLSSPDAYEGATVCMQPGGVMGWWELSLSPYSWRLTTPYAQVGRWQGLG